MDDKPQFSNIDEVREFMRDSFTAAFGNYREADVMSIVETGMVYAEDNIPAIKYSSRRKFPRNCLIAITNIQIRNMLKATDHTTCIAIEVKRAAEAGIKGVTVEVLTEIFSNSHDK